MTTEAGDMKLLGNYRKLIDLLTAEPNYSPSNTKLTIPVMRLKYAAVPAGIQDLGYHGSISNQSSTRKDQAL